MKQSAEGTEEPRAKEYQKKNNREDGDLVLLEYEAELEEQEREEEQGVEEEEESYVTATSDLSFRNSLMASINCGAFDASVKVWLYMGYT